MENKPQITFDEFIAIESKLEIKIGRIDAAERVPKSYGLKLTVNFGGEDVRSVFTNLGKEYEPEQLLGITAPFITNLTPSTIKGVESQAMIMVGKSLEGKNEFQYFSVGTKLF